ncbi:hypothetical protein [Sanguibacter sp. 25GB23B1]|uniref:hypothetical protein n=1 Tax=unclassified Sanguibacter TaxID=2645534 RepID=UPI0032AF4898
MRHATSSARPGHGALAKAAGGAGLLGLLTAVLAIRLTAVATTLDVELLLSGTPTMNTLTPFIEVPLLGLGCVVAAWWSLSLGLVTVALLAHAAGLQSAVLASCIRAVAPAAVRRLAVAGIGAGLVLTAGPALAVEPVPDLGWVSTGTSTPDPTAPITAPPDTSVPDRTDAGTDADSVELALPPAPHPPADDSLTTSPTPPAVPEPAIPDPTPPDQDAPPGTTTITVADGDSLWSITESRLAPGATDAQIAAAWPALHAANEQTIGTDPDVILVGQQLIVPTSPHAP